MTESRIRRRLTKALDRAIGRRSPTGHDWWCIGWQNALKRALHGGSK